MGLKTRYCLFFFFFTFISAIGQQKGIIKDTAAFKIKEFKYAADLDSLLLKEFSVEPLASVDTTALIRPIKLHTDTLKKRLERLNSKSPLNIVYTPMLENLINKYLIKRHKSFKTLILRSQYFFPMFEEALDKELVPLEIKYLSIVESSLRPTAKSSAGASGLWQFMFSTGKHFNLEVNSYVDERCDPIRSTNAAAQYLKKLYGVFGDWDLAMAAYNAGPGNVTKAIRRSGGYKNYWNIRPFLPKETANYIPAFLATLYIFEYADLHGFEKVKNQYSIIETDTVEVKQIISLEHIAKALNIEIESLEFLNPSYKLNIIPVVQGRKHYLRLPSKLIGKFISNETELYELAQKQFEKREKPLPKFFKIDSKIKYKVKSGDYLGKIANKFKVKILDIKRWNGLKSDRIATGDRLIIYTKNIGY